MTTSHLDPSLEAEALRALLDLVPVAVVIFDTRSRRLALSAHATELLGLKSRRRELSAGEQPAGWKPLEQALAATLPVRQLELELETEGGTRKLVLDTVPLASGGGSLGLLRLPPRAGGDDLVAHLAHKLNNPLSTILMSAQLAADGSGASNPERLVRLLTKIQDNARRCGKILEEAVNAPAAVSDEK